MPAQAARRRRAWAGWRRRRARARSTPARTPGSRTPRPAAPSATCRSSRRRGASARTGRSGAQPQARPASRCAHAALEVCTVPTLSPHPSSSSLPHPSTGVAKRMRRLALRTNLCLASPSRGAGRSLLSFNMRHGKLAPNSQSCSVTAGPYMRRVCLFSVHSVAYQRLAMRIAGYVVYEGCAARALA